MEWKIKKLEKLYNERKTTVSKAFAKVKPGSKIFIGSGVSEPQYLVSKSIDYPLNIADTEVFQLVSLNSSPHTDAKFNNMFRLNTFFIGKAARNVIASGDADYTPIFISEIPDLIKTGRVPLDVAIVQLTPPDGYGNCSLGVSVECMQAAIRNSKYVIAQVNSHMPRTMGNSFISIEELDAIIEYDEPILEYIEEPPDTIAEKIGFYVSRLIPNGSTIQAGIGSIPNAVLHHLTDKKDLGVHTEMFSDGLVELYESGAITNRKKTYHNGKIIASFCLGSKKLYDTINNNPVFEFYPTDYISDPRHIAKNDNMCAINSALQVDFTGQVCADSIGHKFYSGIGGQADFMRGSALSKGGRPIIAIPSTAKDGKVSRIVPALTQGGGVVTTRGDVHYVVTEYGIAYLHGKNIRSRVLAMINVAHPKFREELLEEAKRLNYVYQDQELPDVAAPTKGMDFTYKTPEGETIKFRNINHLDEEKLRRFFYGLRKEDVYYRFMGYVRTLDHKAAQPLVVMDYEEKFAMIGYTGDMPDEQLICVGRWFLDRATNMAEVAFTVSPEYQQKGIGSFLLGKMIELAKQKGIKGFVADVLAKNKKMMKVFLNCGYDVSVSLEYGVYSIKFTFDNPSDDHLYY
ncbi:MAG: GNAT family N-acetyltransferase [Myxococcota bacterium]